MTINTSAYAALLVGKRCGCSRERERFPNGNSKLYANIMNDVNGGNTFCRTILGAEMPSSECVEDDFRSKDRCYYGVVRRIRRECGNMR